MLPAHQTGSRVRSSYEKQRLRLTWLLRIVFIHLAIPNSSWTSSCRLRVWFSVASKTRGKGLDHLLFPFLDSCARACASTEVPCIETKCLNQLESLQRRNGGTS